VLLAQLAQTWLEQRKSPSNATGDAEEMLAKIDQLEERIRVLERIVTENRYDLKKEIESL
jgi:hypothetical protein